jgi:hypothetical protein
MLGSDIRLQVQPPEGDAYTVSISLKTAIAFEREFKTTLALSIYVGLLGPLHAKAAG